MRAPERVGLLHSRRRQVEAHVARRGCKRSTVSGVQTSARVGAGLHSSYVQRDCQLFACAKDRRGFGGSYFALIGMGFVDRPDMSADATAIVVNHRTSADTWKEDRRRGTAAWTHHGFARIVSHQRLALVERRTCKGIASSGVVFSGKFRANASRPRTEPAIMPTKIVGARSTLSGQGWTWDLRTSAGSGTQKP